MGITVVDGKLETVHCESRKSNPAPLLEWFLDKPKVTVTRVADDIIEEGKSTVKMSCSADANPPARIFWRKRGSAENREIVETLNFSPVMRGDTGTYVCQAE